MPNYPTHSRWGRIGAVVMALLVGGALMYVFEAPLAATVGALGAAATTFVGAIYPDVDHHKSIPRRKAVKAFQYLVVVLVVAATVLYWDILLTGVETGAGQAGVELPVPPEVAAGAVSVLGAGVLALSVNPLLGVLTQKHRGWTHSVPINVGIVGVLSAGVWFATSSLPTARRVAAVAVVAAFFVGTLIHLGLDGEIL